MRRRLIAGALVAAAATALPVGASWADSQDPTTWQLRAQARTGPGAGLSEPRMISDAMGLVGDAACRLARDLLESGEAGNARLQLTLWRQQGPTDQTQTGTPGVGCESQLVQESAFLLEARVTHPRHPGKYVTTGRMNLRRAVAVTAHLANTYGQRALGTGEQVWLTMRIDTQQKSVRDMIRSLARRYHVDVGTALRVAACESRFNPRAYSSAGPYAGIYQHLTRLWAGRARRYGHPGASVFDPYANIDVSLQMAAHGGWGPWGCY